ncbi:MAG: NADH-quinone oxidoreductase subunit C [Planctomycetota bacterium]
MNTKEIFDYIKSKKPLLEIEFFDVKPQNSIIVKSSQLIEFAEFLKEDSALLFDMCLSICGVDYPKENIMECVYEVFSTKHLHRISFKVRVPRDNPTIPSVSRIWKAADWHERETYDLVGIIYQGHPFLKRILLPEDWEGHPLRKDYVFPKFYRDIPLT